MVTFSYLNIVLMKILFRIPLSLAIVCLCTTHYIHAQGGETFNSFEASNFPGYFIHHSKDGAYIGPILNDEDKKFAEFAFDPSPFQKEEDRKQGLLIFVKPLNAQQLYLRHLNGKLVVARSDDSKAFFDDATFYARKGFTQKEPYWKGVNDGWEISFESSRYPGYYIRHSNYRLYLQKDDGSELFKKDATFIFRWANHKGPLILDEFNTEQARVRRMAELAFSFMQENKVNQDNAQAEQSRLEQQRAIENQQSARDEEQRLAQQRAAEEERRLEQQRVQEEEQRIAEIEAQEEQRRVAEIEAQEEQRRIAEVQAQEEQQAAAQAQQPQYRDKTFTVQIDCKGYSTLTNTGTNDQITVSFVNKDGTKLVDGNSTKVINNCDLDTYISMTSAQLMNEVVAVQITTSGNDGFWMDRVLLHADNQEIAHWGANEGKGYCLSQDPADGNGSWKDFVGARGCQPCFRFEVTSGKVVNCQ